MQFITTCRIYACNYVTIYVYMYVTTAARNRNSHSMLCKSTLLLFFVKGPRVVSKEEFYFLPSAAMLISKYFFQGCFVLFSMHG